MSHIPKKAKMIVGVALILTIGFVGYDLLTAASKNKGIYYGTVEAKEYDICARTSGILKTLSVQEGDAVVPGQVMGKIETDDAEIKLEQSKAALGQAENELAGMTEGARAEEILMQTYNIDQLKLQRDQANNSIVKIGALVSQSEAALKSAKDNVVVKRDDYLNIKSLYESESASADSLKKAKSAYDTAVNSEVMAEGVLKSAQADLKSTKSQWVAMGYQLKSAEEKLKVLKSGATDRTVKSGKLTVAQTKANVQLAQTALLKSSITALVSGVVQSVNYDKGEYVGPGTPVVTIRDEQDLTIKFYVPEKELPFIKTGQNVKLTTTASHIKVDGVVSFVASKAIFTPSNIVTVKDREKLVFEVKVKIKSDAQIKAGMLAEVSFRK